MMPRSTSSLHMSTGAEDLHSNNNNSNNNNNNNEADPYYAPRALGTRASTSPVATRRLRSVRTSDVDLHSRLPSRSQPSDEHASLLGHRDGFNRNYATGGAPSAPVTPRHRHHRHHSYTGSLRGIKNHNRAESFGHRLVSALRSSRSGTFDERNLEDSRHSLYHDERVWYDQFTSTDWVHDSISDAFRLKALRNRKDFRGKIKAWLDGAQGWVLVAIIGVIIAILAYFVDVTESTMFDYKEGYCTTGWFMGKSACCLSLHECDEWSTWAQLLAPKSADGEWINFAAYVILVMALSTMAYLLTSLTRTVIPSAVQLSTLDENLGADTHKSQSDGAPGKQGPGGEVPGQASRPPMIYYSAAGSGVAEVRVILSGFVIHGYLGLKTLVVKTLALVFSVSSGLSIGKEGPYVHIATCVGNIACRLFAKYNYNDGKRREVLSASAASGVAVAFGAPIGGVLFGLEEVSYYFPPKTLFRTFFCCIAAALSLKFLNPYGTNKIVMFEIRYVSDWQLFEMVAFILLGILGGAAGALFIKASRFWARTFRRIPLIKKYPLFEVVLVALITGLVSFWNRYTRLPVTELLFELASPCDPTQRGSTGLCPPMERIPEVIAYLLAAFVIKSILTIITFGIKLPAGIYVPSMVVGGMLGRIVGHFVQYLVFLYPEWPMFSSCPSDGGIESCVVPGVYAMVAAGATMCGVTRLSVTLAVILFELTGSLDHVLPFSLAILVSKWTADAIEPLSIYDLLTDMNNYPFLDNKMRPIFTTELRDITPRVREERLIDISNSPLVLASDLRQKLEHLHTAGELDGGLPIVRNHVLVGLIPAPDLEFALDKLDHEDSSLCLMSTSVGWHGIDDDLEPEVDPTDLTPYIDPAPVALDINSPMDLVYECFVKLGLRHICVLRDGAYAGLVHKKAFVKYVKELEAGEH